MTRRCTPEVWQPELLTQVRIRLLPCVLQVSEAAAVACDPAKETQETLFQTAGRQILIAYSQFCHLRDRSARIHILLIWALRQTQLGPLRADWMLCTVDVYCVSWFDSIGCAFVCLCAIPVRRCISPADSPFLASWPSDCCLGCPVNDRHPAAVCLWSYGPHTPPENIQL